MSESPPDSTGLLVMARTRALARLRALLIVVIVLPAIALVTIAAYLRGQSFHEASLRLDRATRIAQEHALKLFDTNQMLLQRMLDLLSSASDADLLAHAEVVHRRLQQMAAGLPQVQGLFVNGADAHMLASSRAFPPMRNIDYGDRDWYIAHRSGGQPIYITPQLTSRATGERAFDMSQRREVNGQFAGTVHVSLRPQYLTDFYAELARSEPGLRIVVIRNDGAVVARWPDEVPPGARVPMDDPTLRQIAAGAELGSSQDASSPFDGQRRLRSFRRIGNFPLYVVAAVNRDLVLAGWWHQVSIAALLLLPASFGLAWSIRVSMQRTDDELDTLGRLAEETERRRRAEVALLQAQKLEAMGRLTGGVAHDFNNVLSVVSSNLELMRRLPPTMPLNAQFAAIGRAVETGTKLTRQLLAFARKQALLPEQLRLQDRLPALLDLLHPLVGPSIQVSVRVEPDTPPIKADPSEFELALINLAVNASDAMQRQGTIHITARRASEEEKPAEKQGVFVLIDVDDSGPGIDPAIAEKVFEPLFTTKPVGKGTGLGLSQVLAFCQSTDGLARVQTAPGGGARIRLVLRASQTQGPTAAPTAPLADAVNLNVLLVEDNPEVAQATARLLESLGARMAVVSSAEAALARVAAHRADIDVVLSDIEMPGGADGIALAAALRDRRDPVPVVLMSGYAQRLDEAVRAGVDVLPKPCSASVLAATLRRVVESGRSPVAEVHRS